MVPLVLLVPRPQSQEASFRELFAHKLFENSSPLGIGHHKLRHRREVHAVPVSQLYRSLDLLLIGFFALYFEPLILKHN